MSAKLTRVGSLGGGRHTSAEPVHSKQVFPVVIAYSGIASGTRAMHVYETIAAQLGEEFEMRISLWKLCVLSDNSLMQTAIHDAVHAKAVIVSIENEKDLGMTARRWVDSWSPLRNGPGALLVLLPKGNSTEESPTEAYLKNAAVTAKMDFLIQRFAPETGASAVHHIHSQSRPVPTRSDEKRCNMKRISKQKRNMPAGRAQRDPIADAVIDAIECITTVPQESINVTVHQGWVRLEGVLPAWSQKETVDHIVRHVPGVKGLISLIRVEPLQTPKETSL